MRILLRVLLGLLVLVIVLIAGTLIYLDRMDPARFNDLVVDAVRDATGRELQSAGGMRLRLFPNIFAEASGVTISNAPWASEKDMVRAAHVSVGLAWLPLLAGRVHMEGVVIVEPQIFLETDTRGRGNWEPETAKDRPAQSEAPAMAPGGLVLRARSVTVERASIRYHDGVTGKTTNVRVERFDFAHPLLGKTVDVSLRGSYQDLAVAIDGTVGAPYRILADEDIPVDLTANLGDAEVSVEGTIERPMQARGLDLAIAVEAPDTKPFTDLAGIEFENLGPIKARTRLSEKGGKYRLDEVDLAAQGLGVEMTATGNVASLLGDPSPDLRIRASTQSTRRLTDLAGVELEDMGPVTVTGRLVGEGGHFHLQDLNVDASGLGAHLVARGSVTDLDTKPRPDLSLELSAESTTRLAEVARLKARDMGPLEFRGQLVTRDGRLDLNGIELTARPRDAHLSVQGSVASLLDKPKPDVTASLKAGSLRQLDQGLPDVGPVAISARVEPQGHVIEVRELDARVGKSDLGGTLQVHMGGERPKATGKLHARAIHLDELAPPASESQGKPSGRTPATDEQKRVFSADPIPWEHLGAADADLQLTAAEIALPQLGLKDVSISVQLEDGKLQVKPRFGIAEGNVVGAINVDARGSPATVSARLDGKGVKVGRLSEEIRGEELVKDAPTDFVMDVKGSGGSVRTIMAGLDGSILVDIGEGKLVGERINRAGGDVFSQLLNSIIPTGHEGASILQCGVARFEIRDGFAVADQSLVLETNKVLVKGGGAVDLASEELALGARMQARSGLRIGAGSLASLMKVEGTLAEPTLGLNLKGMVTTGARVTGAIFTLGLSLVAENVYGELKGDPNPCKTALAREFPPRARGEDSVSLPGEKALKKSAKEIKKATDKAVEETSEKSEGLLKDIGSGLKGLFK